MRFEYISARMRNHGTESVNNLLSLIIKTSVDRASMGFKQIFKESRIVSGFTEF